MAKLSLKRKLVIGILAVPALLLLGFLLLAFSLRHPLPPSAPDAVGDALARRVQAAVNAPAWERLGAVRWTLGKHHFLWDKARGFVRVRLAKDEVLLDLMTMKGRAFHDGEEQSGERKQHLLDLAYKWFCNDSFWLNPLVKLFDSGTSRTQVHVHGKPALLISYSSGGVTPGDSYLWLLGDDDKPRAWRVWAHVLRFVPGMEFGWEDWIDVGGAKVATSHRLLGMRVQRIRDVAGGQRPEDVEPGPDPFAGLALARAKNGP
jgi:hypothetical protein